MFLGSLVFEIWIQASLCTNLCMVSENLSYIYIVFFLPFSNFYLFTIYFFLHQKCCEFVISCKNFVICEFVMSCKIFPLQRPISNTFFFKFHCASGTKLLGALFGINLVSKYLFFSKIKLFFSILLIQIRRKINLKCNMLEYLFLLV